MASSLVETTTSSGLPLSGVDLSKFPDGFKTSGQHPPVPSQVRPYTQFPNVQAGPTVWKAEDYRENPELWTHQFTNEEIEELSVTADQFIQQDLPLTGISQVILSSVS